jgi:hypothetical protein
MVIEAVDLERVPLEESVKERLADGTWRWFVCGHPWALRHRWVDRETGQTIAVRCGRWDCRHCGPRKVMFWRRLIEGAQPTLFVTLSKAGRSLGEASRALTTWVQALRRGSRREGRPAYAVEYLAVPEQHRNGWWHWHVLVKGVDFLPHRVVSECWRSATRGRRQGAEAEEREAYVVYVERVRSGKVASYVTKYLLKGVARWQRGARRLRYSRRFFERSVRELRRAWFEGEEHGESVADPALLEGQGWMLCEVRPPFASDCHYWLVVEQELRGVLEAWRSGRWKLSLGVILIWERWRVEKEDGGCLYGVV